MKYSWLIFGFITLLVSCSTEADPEAVKQQVRLDFIDTVSANYQLPDSVVIVRDSIVDERDSTVYQIVTIGEQTWFAENLVYIEKPTFGAYYFDNDSTNIHLGGHYPWLIAMGRGRDGGGSSPSMNRLMINSQSEDSTTIDFEKIQGICPVGWHVPTVAEWETLFQTVSDIFDLGANEENDWQGVGKILKDTSYYHYEDKYRGVDLVGFKMIEAGKKESESWSWSAESQFWTSDEYLGEAWLIWMGGHERYFTSNPNGVLRIYRSFSRQIPVRCLKNN